MNGSMASRPVRMFVIAMLVVALSWGVAAVPSGAQAYPARNIIGIIQWGAGGTTDRVSRKVAPLADRHLGQRIVVNNMTGASGATGMQYVFDQPADGYTLLFAAENPTIYGVLDISPRNFDEFEPINLIARSIPVIVVRSDSKYRFLDDLIRDAKQRPGQIKAGGTGIGGVPFVVGAMMTAVSGVKFNSIPFDGDGPALAALLGGHIDFHVSVLSAAAEHMRAGRMRAIAVIDNVPNFGAPGVPALGQMIPAYRPYLPWGPFFGVWVKKGTPAPAVARLTEAFKAGVGTDEFKEFAELLGAVSLNLSGAEAVKWWKQWQSVTAWLLFDAGAAKKSPQAFGIPRPSR